MNIVINKGSVTRSDRTEGKTYRELGLTKAYRMLQALPAGGHWNREGEVTMNFRGGLKAAITVYYAPGGRPILGKITTFGMDARIFVLPSPEAAKDFIKDVTRFNGWVSEHEEGAMEMNTTGDIADNLYGKESEVFEEGRTLGKVVKTSALSVDEANKVTKGTLSKVINKGDVVELVQTIADDYGLKNVEVVFQEFSNGKMGSCAPGEGVNGTKFWMALPEGVRVMFSNETLYQHVVLHEMAHAIELWVMGYTSHGKRFREIYVELLNKYGEPSEEYNKLLWTAS